MKKQHMSASPNKKKNKRAKTLAISFLTLFSLLASGVTTMAWFITSYPVTDSALELKAGESSVIVDAFAYAQNYSSSDGTPVPFAYMKNSKSGVQTLVNATNATSPDSEGVIATTFDSATLGSTFYSSLNFDELSLSEDAFPKVYVELRYTKDSFDGYVKCAIESLALMTTSVTGYTNISSSLDYQYRYITEQNVSGGTLYSNGLKAAKADSAYLSSAWTDLDFSSTTSLTLYGDSDLTGATLDTTKTASKQCYVPGLSDSYTPSSSGAENEYYYSKSTIFEIRVEPFSFLKYFSDNPTAYRSQFNFGFSFQAHLEFSNYPYYEVS